MKKNRFIAFALTALMALSLVSCLTWDDSKEGSPQRNEERKDRSSGGTDEKDKEQEDDAPLMALSAEGDVVSANTPYFSTSKITLYDPKPDRKSVV